MSAAVHAFAGSEAPGLALAAALGVPFGLVRGHRFPDGELLPTVPSPPSTVIVYRSLDRPNDALMELILAAEAWRRLGARRLVLVAPYLAYMRQDAAFQPGQAISQRAVAGLLSRTFDRLVTVNAHLHRTRDLTAVFTIPADSLSAADAVASWLAECGTRGAVLAGPDEESAPLVRATAEALGADWLTFEKHRRGDRDVRLALDHAERLRGRPVVLLDDICSSGATLAAAARRALDAGAAEVRVVVIHALFDRAAAELLRAAGVAEVVSTFAVPHPTNAIPLTGILAGALATESFA